MLSCPTSQCIRFLAMHSHTDSHTRHSSYSHLATHPRITLPWHPHICFAPHSTSVPRNTSAHCAALAPLHCLRVPQHIRVSQRIHTSRFLAVPHYLHIPTPHPRPTSRHAAACLGAGRPSLYQISRLQLHKAVVADDVFQAAGFFFGGLALDAAAYQKSREIAVFGKNSLGGLLALGGQDDV